jgi:hypothetical protein
MRKVTSSMQEVPQYLTIVEAAAILRVSPLSLQNNITRAPQSVPPFIRLGRLIMFHSILLHKFMLDGIANLPSQDHAHLNSVNKKRDDSSQHAHLNSVNKKRANSNNTNQQITFLSPKRGRPRKSEVNLGGQ